MQWSRCNALSLLSLVWVSLLEVDTLAPQNLDWAGGIFLPCFLFGLSPQKSDQRSGKRPMGKENRWNVFNIPSWIFENWMQTRRCNVQTYSNRIKHILRALWALKQHQVFPKPLQLVRKPGQYCDVLSWLIGPKRLSFWRILRGAWSVIC